MKSKIVGDEGLPPGLARREKARKAKRKGKTGLKRRTDMDEKTFNKHSDSLLSGK